MRMVFLDEAGTGDVKLEPFFVLAGVIVDADKQWKAIENLLVDLMEKYCPLPWEARPYNYCFHATELFSGGSVFTHEAMTREGRWAVLDEIVQIPARFDLPIVANYIERDAVPDTVSAYRGCYASVMGAVEAYMRLLPDRNEMASVIAEDLPEVHWWVTSMQRYQQHQVHRSDLHAHERDWYHLTRIVGQPHFEGKSPYSPLQIADACAFAIKRQLMKKPGAERFFDPLVPLMIDRGHPLPGGYVPRSSGDES